MFGVKVTVSGPGGSINYAFFKIQKALEEAGVKVEVENDYPPQKPVDEYLADVDRTSSRPSVKLIADHIPWGG